MGTWSCKPFGNDSAMDWAWDLVANDGVAHIEATLGEAAKAAASLDASLAEEAVAAGAVVAAAASEPVKGVPADIKRWILEVGYVPRLEHFDEAATVLRTIVSESELRDTWVDGGSSKGWENTVNRLIAVLENTTLLPDRAPKKPGMPRLLYKLFERYSQQSDPAVLTKIRSKLESLVDPNTASADTAHRAPLELTLEAGLVEDARKLIANGADVNARVGPCSVSPLTAAVRSGDVAALELLIEHGVELVRQEYSYGADKTFTAHEGMTAVACQGTPEMLDSLIEQGGDIHAQSLNGETLLYFAAQHGNAPMVQHLIALGFDPNDAGGYHTPPLFQAIESNQLDAAKVLLEAGARPSAHDHWGTTALECSSSNDRMKALLEQYV